MWWLSFNPSTAGEEEKQGQRQEDLYEFKAILVYTSNSWPVKVPALKQTNKQTTNKMMCVWGELTQRLRAFVFGEDLGSVSNMYMAAHNHS